ncbi:MAG: hypothetical protein L0G49_12050, partial [Luteococcus sp.]|uniref:hypothetical protein n=1 Tax=Luteococcus sp. TaxID=1969402 RepID=UPI002648D9A7
PTGFRVLDFTTVRAVHAADFADYLILEGDTRVALVDRDGCLRWRTGHLVSDGFDEVRVTSSVVVLRGYSAPQAAELEFVLDPG